MKSVNQSEKLKDIDLKDLGLAFAGERKLKKENSRPLAEMEEAFYSKEEKSFADSRFPYTAQKMSKTMNNNFIMTPPNWNKNKFLPCLNIVEKVEDDNGIFMDEEIDYEKKYYEEDFAPSPKEPKKIIITCTFKRFFSKTVKENILKLAAESPKKLSELVENARREITQKSIFFLYNQTDYQITELICQPNNYSKQAKVYKKEKDFQKIPEVLKWIIGKTCEMQYPSTKWNKAGKKTFTREKELILIIDITLYKEIEIEEEKVKKDNFFNKNLEWSKIPSLFPLLLYKIWECFSAVIVTPLKNDFQFIIMDRKTLLGWQKVEEMKIKYDETNKLTYFLKQVRGGFKFLDHSNAVAFLKKN